MKRISNQHILRTIVVIVFIFSWTAIYATSTPPDPGGDPTSGGGTPVGGGAPIGDGAYILLMAAATYIFWKLKNKVFKRHSILEE